MPIPVLINKYFFLQKTRTSAPISTVTLEQILGLIMEKTIILKIDVEGFECKVNQIVDILFVNTT